MVLSEPGLWGGQGGTGTGPAPHTSVPREKPVDKLLPQPSWGMFRCRWSPGCWGGTCRHPPLSSQLYLTLRNITPTACNGERVGEARPHGLMLLPTPLAQDSSLSTLRQG